MNLKKFISDYSAGLVWAGVSIFLATVLHFLGLFDLLNYKVLDFSFTQIRGPLAGRGPVVGPHQSPPISTDSLDVVLVDVDDESWRLIPYKWPYPRDDVWARVVRNLADAGARVIAFDIEFDSPDFKSDFVEKLNQEGANIQLRHADEVLADAIRYAQSKGTRIVLASKKVNEPTRFPPEYISYPMPRIMAADPEPGLINEIKDFDGTTRKYAVAYDMAHEPDRLYLPLGLKALKEYKGVPDSVQLRPSWGTNEIHYGPYSISTYGKRATYMVNFYGPASGVGLPGEEPWKTFDRYPLSNVLDDAEFDLDPIEEDSDWMDLFDPNSDINVMMQMFDPEYKVPESPFQDKIILIGVSVNVLLDVKTTPFYNYAGTQQLMPGVEYHANAVQTVLDGNYIQVAGGTLELTWQSLGANLLIIIILALITFLLVQRTSPIIGGLFMIIEMLAFVDVALGYFTQDFLWLPKLVGAQVLPRSLVASISGVLTIGAPGIGGSLVVPIIPGMASIVLTYGSIVLYRFLMERRDKQFLKHTFGTYVSPELIDQMYETKQMPELGGESGIRTAYFTDIASFSAFSEILTASKLVELLNEYLTAMTDVLLAQQGTLDKYEGDAIVAFFGAPIYLDDHSYRGCLVALQMQEELGKLREKWASEGDKWPELVHHMRMRIGINTGDLVTGNMGSRTRMNYTMMGDVVNTAARLEASAKQYGIYIQTTMPTLVLAGEDKFEWRFIDKVKVMGKTEAVEAVEIMAIKGELPAEQQKMKTIYDQGIEAYQRQEWDVGIEKFKASEALEETFPKRPTTPSKVYIERCEYFKDNPPGPDWDGSWTLTAK
ncbi:MAG: adenylate/guanylate cyclase domain-containing protein [Fidelibacterota bacterium]|nr:MAG: adenylate/guanylate cyclase domain-containing protein [Candidatus Neomarinimicrobiota bacterium]